MRQIFYCVLAVVCMCALTAPAAGACEEGKPRELICDPNQKNIYSSSLMNLQRVWLMMAVFDIDERRVNTAVVDIGFLDNGETRAPRNECMVNYVVSKFADNIDCAADIYGEYDGLLMATGNDAYATHGTNMKNIVAATLNDGGAAGVAGQVATPNLYRVDDIQSYLFELGPTIRQAVDDGSTVINISGGFPCVIQLNTPPNSQTPNLCTSAGRWQFCTSAAAAAMGGLASLVCGATELEGDLVSIIASAAQYAADSGVPIVGSAGNISTAWLTDYVDLTGIIDWTVANSDAALWSVIPATVGPVIAAGAADNSKPFANQDFHGARVNVWAPFKDTSPAAAFVSGLIALAQATNPQLSPLNASLTSSELKELPLTIRTMLTDTAYTNAELDARCDPDDSDCMTDPTGLRGNLVNPYRFVRTAAVGALPNFEQLGYTDTFDSFEADREPQNNTLPSDSAGDTDWRTDVTLAVGANASAGATGTIFHVPGPQPVVDQDWYFVELTGIAQARVDHRLELRYLKGYGQLKLSSPHDFLTLRETREEGAEVVKIYDTVALNQGSRFPVVVEGVTPTEDNLYQLTVIRGLNVRPNPDRFDRVGGNNNPSHPNNNDSAAAATSVDLTPQIMPAGSNESRYSFTVGDLTIHHLNDNDYFRVVMPAPPNNNFVYQQHLTVAADNPLIRLHASIDGNPFQALGKAGRFLYNNQFVVIHAEPRFPGLNLVYGLTSALLISPIEFEPLPDKAFADLEYFLENMRRHVDDVLPTRMRCVACSAMNDTGTIRVAAERHPIGRLQGVSSAARSLDYLIIERAERVTIDMTANRRQRDRLEIYDARGRRLARSGPDQKIVLDLQPGAYLAVTTSTSRGERSLSYRLVRERLPGR